MPEALPAVSTPVPLMVTALAPVMSKPPEVSVIALVPSAMV